jgi:hypothetical protein
MLGALGVDVQNPLRGDEYGGVGVHDPLAPGSQTGSTRRILNPRVSDKSWLA